MHGFEDGIADSAVWPSGRCKWQSPSTSQGAEIDACGTHRNLKNIEGFGGLMCFHQHVASLIQTTEN